MAQAIENRPRGRPPQYDRHTLLSWECAWAFLFCQLRNGVPASREEHYGSSGIFIKASPDKETVFDSSQGAIKEIGGRQTITTSIPGEKPSKIVQPKFIETKEDKENWESRVKAVDEGFQRIVMGDEPRIVTIPGRPPERHIWEALKLATDGAKVRRAFSQSEIWLKTYWQFGEKHFIDMSWNPFPNALYWHAYEFCNSKLDSRYPSKDQRPSADYKRIEYFARVMAGLTLVDILLPSYSVDILRKMKHDENCYCWRCRAEIKPRFSRSLTDYLRQEFPEDVWDKTAPQGGPGK
jgi:hypothetical protein